MRSPEVEHAIAALAVALAAQEGEESGSERRWAIERGVTIFVEFQLSGGTMRADAER